MESYIRREAKYKEEISHLKEELRRSSLRQAAVGENGPMQELYALHGQILQSMDAIHDRSASALKEQEADLLRAFRAKLYDVQVNLESEKGRNVDGSLEWLDRARTLGKELSWSREEAWRLDKANQVLTEENGHLRSQAQSAKDDQRFLLKQMVAVKRENQALRDAVALQPAVAAARAEGEADDGPRPRAGAELRHAASSSALLKGARSVQPQGKSAAEARCEELRAW